MRYLYRILLCISSTFLMISIYCFKNLQWPVSNNSITVIVYTIISFVIPFAAAVIGLIFAGKLSKDNILVGSIKEILTEEANSTFLPVYLGYFFVALSVGNCQTMVCVYFIVFVFTFVSNISCFNPVFLLFGYRFYYITTSDHAKCFVITRQKLHADVKDVQFKELRRISSHTFIDMDRLVEKE